MTSAQSRFIKALTAKVEADAAVRAAWLTGSFGEDREDRWSDVDAHLLINEATFDSFHTNVEKWLSEIRPLVFMRLMFEGRMVNAMTDEAMRLDIWLHEGASAEVTTGETQVLYEEEGVLDWLPRPGDRLTQKAAEELLLREISEFWRCISMTPVGAGRGERLVGAAGNSIILLVLTNVLCAASGIRRDRGVKALNGFLLPHHRKCVEEAVLRTTVPLDETIRMPMRLARIMKEHGPAICEQWEVEYPRAMEEAVLQYVAKELSALGYDSVLEELG